MSVGVGAASPGPDVGNEAGSAPAPLVGGVSGAALGDGVNVDGGNEVYNTDEDEGRWQIVIGNVKGAYYREANLRKGTDSNEPQRMVDSDRGQGFWGNGWVMRRFA